MRRYVLPLAVAGAVVAAAVRPGLPAREPPSPAAADSTAAAGADDTGRMSAPTRVVLSSTTTTARSSRHAPVGAGVVHAAIPSHAHDTRRRVSAPRRRARAGA